ncbi:unnamed protein product [Phytophthora lilii]|uniref:Unnamed protein product n=1 Tax=Phytophthora lilii TaxID=2077276 RepID=A0A9W6YDK2_9STRA|nr:unnamed protein product [Phytophthora lilii]
MEHWDSSYIYKIILNQCQSATEIDPQTLIQQARTLYCLKDESVEDMRTALRRLPQLRKAEFTVLATQTHFSHLELEKLQDEFTFLRFQKKMCGRSKLRGLRQEELESILAREFKTVNLLCCLLTNRMVVDAEGHRPREPSRSEHSDSTSAAAKSPLLRRHFRTKLLLLATSDSQLQCTDWLEYACGDSEIDQLMMWESIKRRLGGILRMKTRSVSFWSMTPIQPTLSRASSDSLLPRQQQQAVKRLSKANEKDAEESPEQQLTREDTNNFGIDAAPFLRKPGMTTADGLVRRRQVTLLSRKLSKKFKASWPPAEAESLVRNPFEEPSGTGAPYVFWCHCTVS